MRPEYPELLNVMTRFVIGLERYGPILAFLPFFNGPARMLAVVLFVAFHTGILIWMRTGIFPVACIVAWLVFLPTWLWEKLGVGGDVASRLRLPRWRGSGGARHPRLRLPLERRHRLGWSEAPRDVERPRVPAAG